jgi:hypothetical protein
MLEGACCVIKEVASQEGQGDDFSKIKRGGLNRLIRVYGYVMATVHRWKREKGASGPTLINLTSLPEG